jgi:hypothetical protein
MIIEYEVGIGRNQIGVYKPCCIIHNIKSNSALNPIKKKTCIFIKQAK